MDVQTLIDLCDDYVTGRRRFVGKPEEETKQQLVEPFLTKILGWSSTHAQEYYDREYLGKVKGIEWKDIALIVKSKPLIFIETKSCSDKNIDKKYARDLLKYLKDYNSDKPETDWVSWGILTNFAEWFIYHWSEPSTKPKPFYTFSSTELGEKLPVLKEILSPDGVKNNKLLNRFYESPGHKLDEEFLKDLKKWRKIIANAFYQANPELAIEQISEISHIFLSRLIFLRRLEAIGVLKPRWVKSQFESWKEGKTIPTATFSDYIRMLFNSFWQIYDTELFKQQECDMLGFDDQFFEDLLKEINSSPQRVREIVGIQELQDKGLYGYNFMELSLDILGTVYERYLAHTLEFKVLNGKRIVSIDETPKLRQTEGAYFTPPHIVKLILNRTLAPRLSRIFDEADKLLREGRLDEAKTKIHEVEKIKLLDPACGSGSFLIEAFKMITSVYLKYNSKVTDFFKGKSLVEQKVGEYKIEKIGERTLLENLYGVDLDVKAVELTKLNLWLHHIDLNRSGYYYSGGATKKKLLPPLDLNIKCGNSMVCHNEEKLSTFNKEIQQIKKYRDELRQIRYNISLNTDKKQVLDLQKHDEEIANQINSLVKKIDDALTASIAQDLDPESQKDFENPFDWKVRFPEVFSEGGLDVYVGNPPYINLYNFSGKFRDYLEKKDSVIFANKNDILYHFYKLGLDLLKENGRLGYITSRYFLEAENADKLRGWLPKQSKIEVLIDWGNVELFEGINTRCVVMILSKSKNAEQNQNNVVSVAKIKNWKEKHNLLTDIIEKHIGQELQIPPNVSIFKLSQSELTKEPWRLLDEEEKLFRDLLEKDAWRLGGKDGLCNMGMGMQTGYDAAFRVTKSEIDSEKIPMEFVRKLVRNGDIRRDAIHNRDEYWIYTENTNVGELPDDHPVKKHLLRFYDQLVQRYPCRITDERPIPKRKWFQYTVPNIRDLFELKEKMVVPYKAPSNRFAMDCERRICSMDVYVLSTKDEYRDYVNDWFLLAILNSSLMDYAYITFYGRRKKSEFDYYTGLLEKIPIKKPATPEIRDTISTLSREISELSQKRIDILEAFKETIDSELHELVKFEHYYGNAFSYTISKKHAFLKIDDANYKVYHIGCEEIDSKLVFDSDFKDEKGQRARQKVLEITIDNKNIREFLLLSVKSFIEENRRKKTLGKNHPLKVIIKNVLLPKFETNIHHNISKIENLIDEIRRKQNLNVSLSEIEKSVVAHAEQINKLVLTLYGLDKKQQQRIEGLSKRISVSEYFDRIEEYVGLEDMAV